MHIETLKIFCDLVELRSFFKTAERNLLSQSAVSQQVQQLELSLKCQLFDRTKRPIEITDEGRLFYEAATAILDRYARFKSDLAAQKAAAANRVNVAAIYSIGMHTLPDYVKKFMLKFGDVNIHVEYLSAAAIYERVLAGDIDVGLVAVPRQDKRVDVYHFQDELLVLAVGAQHPLAGRSQVDIHEVHHERFIGFEQGVPTRAWVDGILQRYDIVVRPQMEFDNVETIKRAVEIGAGISILPRTVLLQEVAAGTIKELTFSNENFVRPTAVIIRRNRVLSQPARQFVELLCGRAAARDG